MEPSSRTPQAENTAHHHKIYGFTNMQRFFILATTVAVVAATVFSLITLGVPQAITIGGVLGISTFLTLSEFIRVRMVKLSQIRTYNHSEWALFPKGLFAHANIVRRPRAHRPHESTPENPPQITVNSISSSSDTAKLATSASPRKHRSTHSTHKRTHSTGTV